jgi:hypothetical protein
MSGQSRSNQQRDYCPNALAVSVNGGMGLNASSSLVECNTYPYKWGLSAMPMYKNRPARGYDVVVARVRLSSM